MSLHITFSKISLLLQDKFITIVLRILFVSRALLLTVLLAGLIVVGTSTPAWAASLDARINPNNDTSPFKMTYQKTVFIEYPNGGNLFKELQGKEWTVANTVGTSDPGVQDLMKKLNNGIADDGSQARISDLNVTYDIHLKARNINTSIDYKVILEGTLSDYTITKDSQRTLVDLGWRGLTAEGEIVVDGVEINIPINILRDQEPSVYAIFAGTEAEEVLHKHLINADFILEQPLTNWHFLFDPTGINVDAGTFGLDEEIAGFVRDTAETIYHPVGTCKMGNDSLAVVDEKLRVHGVARTVDEGSTRDVQAMRVQHDLGRGVAQATQLQLSAALQLPRLEVDIEIQVQVLGDELVAV